MFDHEAFSRQMKLALAEYLSVEGLESMYKDHWIEELSGFNPNSIEADNERKAFWINLYNGLTNYHIISRKLKESVWEVPEFFSGLKVHVGDYWISLDDIEHGILRRNGARRNGKPRQFEMEDERLKLMVDSFDPRIHFALNCGSISCPPIAFYSAKNIDEQLALAEENFVKQEFIIDHEKGEVRCSEILIWYRDDFPDSHLNNRLLKGYSVVPIAYEWKIF